MILVLTPRSAGELQKHHREVPALDGDFLARKEPGAQPDSTQGVLGLGEMGLPREDRDLHAGSHPASVGQVAAQSLGKCQIDDPLTR